MDQLMDQLTVSSPQVAAASERVLAHRRAGTAPDILDRELVDTWLQAVISFSRLSCNRPHPQLKAQGALQHHQAERLQATVEPTPSSEER